MRPEVNMYIKRYIEETAFSSGFGRQMRFISGPRQSGKTTMAKKKLDQAGNPDLYFNWDQKKVRDLYRNEGDFIAGAPGKKWKWACFDEMHKMPKWKNILKGFFDENEDDTVFIVTGSARLDVFRKSGDSLAGRYFSFKINPLMIAELDGAPAADIMPEKKGADFVEKAMSKKSVSKGFRDIMKLGPFPEPLIKGDALFAARWHDNYMERIIKEDMRDLTQVQELEKVVDLVHMLPSRIGAPLSINSLREDLEMNHGTVKKYIGHLASMYALFLIPPYTGNITRPVKKEKKAYFYDYALAASDGSKFENFVAVELTARVDLWNNTTTDRFALFFVRNTQGKETDFMITRNNAPYVLFEAKLGVEGIEAHHKYNSDKMGGIPFVQVCAKEGVCHREEGRFFSVSAERFF